MTHEYSGWPISIGTRVIPVPVFACRPFGRDWLRDEVISFLHP
jgi:hypothetical protein